MLLKGTSANSIFVDFTSTGPFLSAFVMLMLPFILIRMRKFRFLQKVALFPEYCLVKSKLQKAAKLTSLSLLRKLLLTSTCTLIKLVFTFATQNVFLLFLIDSRLVVIHKQVKLRK